MQLEIAPKVRNIALPPFDFTYSFGQFDGASQNFVFVFRAGMVLSLNISHFVSLWMGMGRGQTHEDNFFPWRIIFTFSVTKKCNPYRLLVIPKSIIVD